MSRSLRDDWIIAVAFCLLAAVLGFLAARNPVEAQNNGSWPLVVATAQPPTTLNAESLSSNASAQTKSIAAIAGRRVYLYSVNAWCAGATAVQLTVKDGVAGTTIWTSNTTQVPVAGGTSGLIVFHVPLASSVGNGMDITVGACASASKSTLDVQASQF
jgi:hypothetical protein